jgi:hypothetical protein
MWRIVPFSVRIIHETDLEKVEKLAATAAVFFVVFFLYPFYTIRFIILPQQGYSVWYIRKG